MNSRVRHLLAAVVTLPLGYLLRFSPSLPEWLRDAAGGAAYVALCAFLAGVLWPRLAPLRLALGGFLFTAAVELSQLWHPAWLNAVRATRPGRLVLGSTFRWLDFPPYLLGAGLAFLYLRWSARAAAPARRGDTL